MPVSEGKRKPLGMSFGWASGLAFVVAPIARVEPSWQEKKLLE